MPDQGLSAEAQAVLLLCGQFGKEAGSVKPLTLSEFNNFSRWLSGIGLPASLLVDSEPEWLTATLQDGGFDPERFSRLLARGSALAFAVEQWNSIGMWVITRDDADYPENLKIRLKHNAPAILYGAGPKAVLKEGGLAVVGSRNADEEALTFARIAGEKCASENLTAVSGGARGVDSEAMSAALENGGATVGVLAENLEREMTTGKYRPGFEAGRLVLVSPFHPRAVFNVGNAMERNKLIYALADRALVVSAESGKGGTWQGATENLKQGWVPLLVRDDPNAPDGNRALIKRGGIAVDQAFFDGKGFRERLEAVTAPSTQPPKNSGDSLGQQSLL
jgi:predicted Rossmann fold nucleotide-binding protein DprA/Smf involved in DNA uptake